MAENLPPIVDISPDPALPMLADPVIEPATEPAKDTSPRVVLEHTTGRMRGYFKILGTVESIKRDLNWTELPAFVPDVDFVTHHGPASLVKATGRYLVYREIDTPALVQGKQFNPEQR